MEKDKLFFLPTRSLANMYKTSSFFFSLFGFHCSVECYIYIYIYIYSEESSVCFRCIIFSYFFFLRKERRTGKKRSYDDTHWFSLIACCYNDDLYLIIEIDCLRPFMRTFFSFPSLIYSY
jgi:hypothetical protein